MRFGRARREITLKIGVFSGSYWGTPNGDSYQILDDAIDRFEAEHPGVQVEYVSGISVEDYSEWLAGQFLRGEEPDLCFVLPEDLDLLASSGALLPLDGLLREDQSFDTAIYYDACLEAGRFSGAQYALPYESVPTLMFVNKTLLERCGLAMPDNDWTWEDFYTICAAVAAHARGGEHPFGMYGYDWKHALYANGATLFSDDGASCYLASSGVQSAIQFQKRLEDLNGAWQVTARDFDLGNVAFRPFLFSDYRAYQPYPWRVKKYSSFEWDCVQMPAGPNGQNVSELHTMLLGISARSRRKDLSWAFLKLLSGDETLQKELYTYSQGISPVRSVTEDEEIVTALFADMPDGSSLDGKVIGEIMRNAVSVPRFGHYEQALAMAESAVSAALSSDQTLNSYLLREQREINIFLSS